MGFTPAQQNAIDAKGKTLLVSAAAGSGKTFTLTQRIIKSIIENQQDISRLLIVTFTRAAASELRAKISAALSKAISENPGNIHLQKQLIKLGNAHISTIDSFFSEPIRANFEKLSLPASIRLSDEAELSPLRDAAMMETVEKFFESCGGHDSDVGESTKYSELLGIITAARNISTLIPTLTEIYKKLITSPEGVEQLRAQAERMRNSAAMPFFETEEGKIIHGYLTSLLHYVCGSFDICLAKVDDIPKYFDAFSENKEQCEHIALTLKQKNYTETKLAFEEFAPARLPSVPKDSQPPEIDRYKDMRSKKLNPAIKNAATTYFSLTEDEIKDCFLRNAELCDLLCNILTDFEKRYSDEKLRRGVCEFSDMPKLMLKLLLNKDGSPSEYCMTLRESFDEVYIDEYQDVNEIQDRIFELIGTTHRFMVGDIKQSIYGFREAEPSIFADYRKKFIPYENDTPESSSEGNTIFMSNNFRCDKNVITFTNTVCSQIFSAFAQSIGYTGEDDLIFTKALPHDDYSSPAVKINLIEPYEYTQGTENEVDETIDDTAEAQSSEAEVNSAKSLSDEAIVIANEIERLISSKDERRADGKRITAGDIAILVRSHSYSKPLTVALDMLNIKYTTSSKGAMFDDKELKLIVDLLSVIDNPRDDVPLSRLLSANTESVEPIMTLEEIIEVRKSCEDDLSLYDAMLGFSGETALAQKCRDFTELCDKLRRVASKVSADKLLRTVVQYERYAQLVNTDAYTYVYDRACKYTSNYWSGLGSFLSYFKALMEKGDGGADSGSKDDDAVTIMTIHQSKGLEFCVCILFGLGKKFNLADSKSPLIFSKDLGVSMKLPPRSEGVNKLDRIKVRYTDNPLVRAADLLLNQKQLEEEARIFYVALTRARERLYLSATLKKTYLDTVDDIRDLPDPIFEISQGKSYINQTLIAISRHICNEMGERYADNNDFFEIDVFQKGLNFLTMPLISDSDFDNDEIDEEMAKLMSGRLDESVEDSILASIPSKVAASKVSSKMLDDSVFVSLPLGTVFANDADEDKSEYTFDRENLESIKRRIDLMRSAQSDFDSLLEVNKKPTAAERGTATHEFLQFCDYENVDKHGVDDEIARLLDQKFITERTAKIIDRNKIAGFFKSSLYHEIKNAKQVYREFRFGMFRPATDFTENESLKMIVSDRKIFVQGSIDLIIERTNGDILLCDYKTDRIPFEIRSDKELIVAEMTKKHGEQLKEYRNAISKIFERDPVGMFIYSVTLGETIEIKI